MIDDVEIPTHGDQPEPPVPLELPGGGGNGRGGTGNGRGGDGNGRSPGPGGGGRGHGRGRCGGEPGVDRRGIARATVADVTGGSKQGASTIAQQFVKNALPEQANRTVFEKLRGAALAYHLTRRWSKQRILTEYLNSIYFGN